MAITKRKVIANEDPLADEITDKLPPPMKVAAEDYKAAIRMMRAMGMGVANSPGSSAVFHMLSFHCAVYRNAAISGTITRNMWIDALAGMILFCKQNRALYIQFARQMDKRKGL